jgi:hypothetical protein
MTSGEDSMATATCDAAHSTRNARPEIVRFPLDPVSTFGFFEVRPLNEILQHSTVLLDGLDRPDVVLIARQKSTIDSKLVSGDLE